MISAKDRQRAYRERREQRFAAMQTAPQKIGEISRDKTSEAARTITELVDEALSP